MIAARDPDFFISHDSRDKSTVAMPLYYELTNFGYKVWLGKFELKVGDSLFESINYGVTNCKHGILILSRHYLENEGWARKEMNALMSRAFSEKGKRAIMPIWCGIDENDVRRRSAFLADIIAVKFEGDIKPVVDQISSAVPR